MSKITKTTIIAALALTITTGPIVQSRTFYDSYGKSIGRSSTGSSGTVTNYVSDLNSAGRFCACPKPDQFGRANRSIYVVDAICGDIRRCKAGFRGAT